MSQFQHGLCGCCDDCSVCCLSLFLPCYVFGKTAEKVDENCCLCGLLTFCPLVGFFAMCSTRAKVREASGVNGNCFTDLTAICCCTYCALTQMAMEVDALK